MTQMPSAVRLSRRALLAAPWLLSALARPARAAAPPVVTLLGDSITTGFGLAARDALPVQLQRELAALGTPAQVRSAGVVGGTTANGLSRVDSSVRSDTDVCVVALGGNDLLTLTSPARTRANLDAIVRRLRARDIAVVIAGLQAPIELGAYGRAFNAAFAEVAHAHGAPLYASLLAGVLFDSRYNQPDLVHPNAAGVRLIARGLAPVVAAVLRSATGSKGAVAARP